MNLMDMLMENGESFRNYLEFGATEQYPVQSVPKNVYYLPTVFTKLQKDMSEAVVQIFRPALTKQLAARNQRTSINSLLDSEPVVNGTGDQEMNDEELGALMFDQLRQLSRHPSLVVDHFIPKKLLLLELKDRLLHMSGKLVFFDRLVDLIAKEYELGELHDNYNLLVVAENVREIEWIEGQIIGKKLNYVNLSARKLYDAEEKLSRFVKEDSVDEDQQNPEFKKRRRHFVARQSKSGKYVPQFTLHLVTCRQLYLSYSSNTPFDMIVSFDSDIDVESASIELLRTNNKANNKSLTGVLIKTPVIIPISLFSIEHFITLLPKPNPSLSTLSDSEKQWKLKVSKMFIANRHQLFKESDTNFYLDTYGRNFALLHDWLFQWDRVELENVKQVQDHSNDVSRSCSPEKLEKRLNDNHLQALGKIFADTTNGWDVTSQSVIPNDASLNYETFKKRFAEFLNSRIAQAETLIHEGTTSILPAFRDAEARRQEEIDQDEDLVGQEYRKLRKLNEEASNVDRKFDRFENEHARILALESETSDMLTHLEDVTTSKDEEDLLKLVDEQLSLLKQLEEEKSKLDAEYKRVTEETDNLRTEYQSKSARALESTEALSSAKALQARFEAKLNKPGMTTLPTLTRRDELQAYETEKRRIKQENTFIKLLFLKRLDQLVKERSAILDTTNSGSSSRPSNRISRASTPFT
ncbi:CIC11C00000001640 [Sungouiella intermedia]|uniref:CIC11C00000001640 n=1 Tax=Sungouiella intermedia TaxID=45354 RepID=A0A1L0BF46_9ASCO|nr:CIC11C00000001640 [[Candida] intermedia]